MGGGGRGRGILRPPFAEAHDPHTTHPSPLPKGRGGRERAGGVVGGGGRGRGEEEEGEEGRVMRRRRMMRGQRGGVVLPH
jgi:hypothetical protein